jgi:hypothetical protein
MLGFKQEVLIRLDRIETDIVILKNDVKNINARIDNLVKLNNLKE